MQEAELPRASVLLVDDQPNNLLALSALLEPLELDVVAVRSGAEALKQLLLKDFAVILLDVQMPGMDGFETAAMIKSRPRTRDVPILFLTAINKEDAFVFRGYSVGAVDYLFKPFHADVLRSKVAVFVDLYRKTQQIRAQAEIIRLRQEQDLLDLRRASERRYRDLAESMPQIVWTADAAGHLTYRNRRWTECAGRGAEQSLEWQSVLHPDDVASFRRQWETAIESGHDWEAEYRFGSASSGAYRWHLVRAVATKQEDGKRTWVGTSTDIDDRKRAARALRFLVEASTALASWAGYEAALGEVARAAVPVLGDWCAVVAHDAEGHARRAEAGAISLVDASHTSGLDVVMRAIDRCMETGRRKVVPSIDGDEAPGSVAEELRGAIAALGFHAMLCVPIVTRDRAVGALAFMLRERGRAYHVLDVRLAEDVARRVATAVENQHLVATAERERTELAAANRAKDEFLAVLSHELRTPLNSMLGWTQLARNGELDDRMLARALETIERNAKTQAQLIADLLDVSRIVSGKLSVDLGATKILPVVEQAVEAAKPQAAAANVTLDVCYGLDAEEVNGDPARLQQVVSNLLSNAIKFTPAGAHVRVRVEREEDRACVVVEDEGHGIDPRFLPHVFERFRQAEGATTRAHGGLGLGLAIVRHIVDVHGGEVTAESEGIGKGARFTVRLPILSAAARATSRETASLGADDVPRDVLQSVSVLVVEDDEDGRELLEMVLADYGARVRSVTTVADAIATLRGGDVDVLVSDIGLPTEDGYALIERARALAPVPAIALTAYASLPDRARALSAGFDAHLTKPVEPHVLAATVASLARRMSATLVLQGGRVVHADAEAE